MKTHDWRPLYSSYPTLGVSSENLKTPVSLQDLHEAGWYFQVTLGSLSLDGSTKGHAQQDHAAEPPPLPVPKGHPITLALESEAPGCPSTSHSHMVLKGLHPDPKPFGTAAAFLSSMCTD